MLLGVKLLWLVTVRRGKFVPQQHKGRRMFLLDIRGRAGNDENGRHVDRSTGRQSQLLSPRSEQV